MADGTTVDWHGTHEFEQAIDRLKSMADDKATEALKEIADRTVDLGKHGSSKTTAAATDAVGRKASANPMRETWMIDGPRRTGPHEQTIRVGPTSPHARRQDLGYRRRQGRGHGHTKPTHWFSSLVTQMAGIAKDTFAVKWNPKRW